MDSRDVDSTEENENVKEDVAEQWEKGYDLPIDEPERKEAEDECKMILELISDIYAQADKGEAANTVLDDKTIYKMQNRIKEKGYPVTTMKAYAAMENMTIFERILKTAGIQNKNEQKENFVLNIKFPLLTEEEMTKLSKKSFVKQVYQTENNMMRKAAVTYIIQSLTIIAVMTVLALLSAGVWGSLSMIGVPLAVAAGFQVFASLTYGLAWRAVASKNSSFVIQ